MDLRFKINNALNNQKQPIVKLIIDELGIIDTEFKSIFRSFLNRVYDYLLTLNHDLCVCYKNKKIIGFAFVANPKTITDYREKLAKLEKLINECPSVGWLSSYLYPFRKNLEQFEEFSPVSQRSSYVTWAMFFDWQQDYFDWFLRSLLNYYCLQDRDWVYILNWNQKIVQRVEEYTPFDELAIIDNWAATGFYSPKCYGSDFDFWQLTSPVINNLKSNYTVQKILTTLNYKDMWSKTFKSPIHPENNIIMIHGVNSYGLTFMKMVPYLLNYGNVILLDLPIHGQSKAKAFLDIEWDINKYAIFLYSWIEQKGLQNIYLYGHSMGGAIASILNLYCANLTKGLIIEDGYNGYCSILNQKITTMTKSLLKNYKIHKNILKQKEPLGITDKNMTVLDFYNIYKPFTKKTWMFFANLFNVDILAMVNNAYILNFRPALAMYGIMDGVVDAQAAQEFFKKLPLGWTFEFVPNATHSSHEDNLDFVVAQTCSYLQNCTNDFRDYTPLDLDQIETSIDIGSPYIKKENPLDKLGTWLSKMIKL